MAQNNVKRDSETRPSRVLPKVGFLTVLVAVAVCALAIFFLANSMREEIDNLASANSDTTQWSLAQTEVDLLSLQVALEPAADGGVPDLRNIRRRFDILYSRIGILSDSRQFAVVRENPAAMQHLDSMVAFLQRYVPMIDGDDATLIAALPALEANLSDLRDEVRAFSSLGVRAFADQSDVARRGVAALLTTVGALTAALVVTLSLVVGTLLYMFRRSARTERHAAATRNQLQNVISTSIDAILAVDEAGRVTDYNGAAEAMFGYSRDEAIGTDMAALIIPDHMRQAHDTGMARFRNTGEMRVVGKGLLRLEAKRRDGTVFPVDVTISALRERGRRVFVAFLRDVSDSVAAERNLVEARDKAVAGEKAKSELLAVMSHEMRTPLNGLLGSMELLDSTPLDTTQKRYLSAMDTSARLLLHHVNDVLTISRAEAGQLHLVVSEIVPQEFLTQLIDSQFRAIELNGNRITCSVSPEPAQIWADRVRLNQVLLNLVGNANKFTRNGEITVECEALDDGKTVEFRVIDTGIGIAEDDQSRIFEDFRMLDASYGRSAEGTGLGLGIAKRLVETMGGEIGLESELGEGSLFWVRLPIGEPSADMASPAQPVTRRTPGCPFGEPMDILLVEDNQINRLVAREMLEKCGHHVTEAHDGLEGIHFAQQASFHVILMDISMPEVDGVTATHRIRTEDGPNRHTPIIALTAHALPEDLARFEAAGITQALIKPLTQDSLYRALTGVAPAPATPAPSESAVMIADLGAQLGHAKTASLVAEFIDENDALVARLDGKIKGEAARLELAAMAHKCAGSAAVFRTTALAESLRALETAFKAGKAPAIKTATAALRTAWAPARADLVTQMEALEPAD